MKNVLFFLLFCMFAFTANAKNPCSKFKTPKGSHAKFGDNIKKTERIYKKKTPSSKQHVLHKTNILITLEQHTKNYKVIAYGHLNNVVHTIMVVYKEDYVRSKGGLVNAFTILSKALVNRYEKADTSNTEDNEFNLIWRDVNGVEVVMMAQPPLGLKIRYVCEAQKQIQMDQIAKQSDGDL